VPLPSSSTFVVIRLLAAGSLAAAAAVGQQVRAEAPLGATAPTTTTPQASSNDDPGVAVDMFDNPNLDRFLWRAKGCLEREDFTTAINLLQQVIEGRTSEVILEPGEPTPPGDKEPSKEPAKPENGKPEKPEKDKARSTIAVANRATPASKPEPPKQPELDARNTVFSQDGRLYRPVSRLCHELLARMPAAGLEIYRTNHEVAAEQLLQQALADGSISALEHVADRYFVTLPAGRAMALLADRLMHEGRYRAAVVVLRDLLDVYPAEHRQRLGISDVWCRFKIALCLALAGEDATAHEAVTALAQAYPLESLRVQGELYAVKDLPSDQLFARDVAAIAAAPRPRATSCLDEADCQLVPLWQFRFSTSDPYKEPKPSNDRSPVFSDGGMTTAAMPFAGRYGPGTCVTFAGLDASGLPQVLFLEHFRLRAADATNGLLAAQSDGIEQPPTAKDQSPRVRNAASDFALLRPVFDGARCYVITGYRSQSSSIEVLKSSELSALQPDTLQKLWSSSQWLDGDAGLRDVTFLAAPTVFGERLLLPALRRGRYSLECLERETGRPLWNVPIHGGGTPFWKAPGCPVVVQGGIAYVATNAGCVASVDAFTGDLRWIRRYERSDPVHKRSKTKKPARGDEMGWQGQFRQEELTGFVPNDMFAINGLLILAACDSDMLLGLDGATGQPQWMLDGTMTTFVPYGKLRALVGLIGDDLFAVSDTHLVAIGATGGLVKWARELPSWNGPKQAGRGRGTVAGNRVLIPGEHEILAYTTDGTLAGRIALPAFDSSREPLGGSAHLFADGAWLAVGYQGGVEMFSTAKALRQLADSTTDTSRKADLLLRSGDGDAAIEVLCAAIRGTQDARQLRQFGGELLAIVRERAYATARTGDCTEALQLLDRYQELLVEPGVRMMWLLARVELCKERGDLLAHEREQNRLYSYMEGKG
jgi:outer membrane protein assembly factor BamB